jgi:ParB-like chromosome segregation protein Spo0J
MFRRGSQSGLAGVGEHMSSIKTKLLSEIDQIIFESMRLGIKDKISFINSVKRKLHSISPFNSEPVDCIQWIENNEIAANDYNPNKVAPPEMKLLEISIDEDGFTQPIVVWKNGGLHEVVDGFHRNRVGRESAQIGKRLHGFLPVAVINSSRLDRGDRIAATIRHNRARGKHQIDSMSEIVLELKRRNWSKEKIGRDLGMDPDEVLRLSQITGLAEMFADKEFSEAWEAEGIDESDSLNPGDENG